MGVLFSLGTTPGSHTFTVRVTKSPQAEARYASRGDGHLNVVDANTQENLGQIPLAAQEVAGAAGVASVELVWPFQVQIYR
jgi:hypothetical protein